MRPPRPAPEAAATRAAPSTRITIITFGIALAWAAALPLLLARALPQRPGMAGAAEAWLWSPLPHTAAAAAFLLLMLLRQGRWYRSWQSALLLALGALYLAGCVVLVVAARAGGAAPAR